MPGLGKIFLEIMFLTKFMNSLKQKRIIFVIMALLGIFALILIVIIIFYKAPASNKSAITPIPTPFVVSRPSPTQLPTDLEKDYSNLNKIIPGKSTLNDVKKINGIPQSVSTLDDKTYAYYKTPLEGFTNKVLIEKNLVVYSIENVFGSYRGGVESYESGYGSPDLVLYKEGQEDYPWFVYLKYGLAIENDGHDVLAIVYFVPQSSDSFTKTIAKELKLSDTISTQE